MCANYTRIIHEFANYGLEFLFFVLAREGFSKDGGVGWLVLTICSVLHPFMVAH